MTSATPGDRGRRRFESRPSTIEILLTGAWLTVVLVRSSDFGWAEYLGPLVIVLLGGLVLACVWIVRAGVAVIHAIPQRAKGVRRSAGNFAAWLFLPAAITAGVADAHWKLSYQARLALSEPALRAAIAAAPPGTHAQFSPPQRIGLFSVSAVMADVGCTTLVTNGDAASYECLSGGLVFAPGGEPRSDGIAYRHVRGPWWCWYRAKFMD
ncbi:MAG: hypothetical protein HY292_02030 [Planctomycetes bacterium]|nr:hypothetical protein [Planctomycetota bacterium]